MEKSPEGGGERVGEVRRKFRVPNSVTSSRYRILNHKEYYERWLYCPNPKEGRFVLSVHV